MQQFIYGNRDSEHGNRDSDDLNEVYDLFMANLLKNKREILALHMAINQYFTHNFFSEPFRVYVYLSTS